jgi:hypothetical protein
MRLKPYRHDDQACNRGNDRYAAYTEDKDKATFVDFTEAHGRDEDYWDGGNWDTLITRFYE